MKNRKSKFLNFIAYLVIFNYTIIETQSLKETTESLWTNGSTFKEFTTTSSSAANLTTCSVPVSKTFLIAKNAINDLEIALGVEILRNTPVIFSCKTGYILKGYNNSICGTEGRWTKSLPTCIYFCTDQHPRSGFSTKAYFELDGIDVSNAKQFEPHTIATISCKDCFSKPGYFVSKLECLEDGWFETKIPCEMQCGQPALPFTPFSRGGSTANITEVPWHVGIYERVNEKFENICGGVLISPRVVITAAHCFFRNKFNVETLDLSIYAIAAGKYYREFNSDKESETSKVETKKIIDIWIPKDYTHSAGNFYGDIAILKLNEFITFSQTIRPICLFPIEKLNDAEYKSFTGKLSTWSQQYNKAQESTLKTLHMSAISLEVCKQKVTENLQLKTNIPDDKFCLAAYDMASVACKGDSGSGFVVKMPETNDFVLYGLVSFSPIPTQDCARHNLLVVTNVLYYQDIIEKFKREDLENDVEGFDKKVFETKSKAKKFCRLPSNIDSMMFRNYKSGRIITLEDHYVGKNAEKLMKRYNAPANTVYNVICDNKHALRGNNIAVCDQNGHWMSTFPKCVASESSTCIDDCSESSCKLQYEKPNLVVINAETGTSVPLGTEIPEETRLEFACEHGYTLMGQNNTICENEYTLSEEFLPSCHKKYCTDKHPRSGFSTKATFAIDGDDVSYKNNFEPGTIAKISCAHFYKKPSKAFKKKLTCAKDDWSSQKVACEMRCGRPADLIISPTEEGFAVNATNAPWHIDLYKKQYNEFQHICGGNLISPRIVVSAAHCFFGAGNRNNTKIDLSLYSVAAGKKDRIYDRDNSSSIEVQWRNIAEVWTHNNYKGMEDIYYHDISIIKLARFLIFTDTIRPVCLHLPDELEHYVADNIDGRISLWIDEQQQEPAFHTVNMATVTGEMCKETFLNKSHLPLRDDKFCLNSFASTAVCESVNLSGSGFIVRMPDNTYALYGIVSGLDGDRRLCDRDSFLIMTDALLYTSVLRFYRDQDLKNDIDFEE